MAKTIETLDNKPISEIELMEVDSEKIVALEKVLRYYLEDVLESNLKSNSVMKGLKNESR